ncbi:sugar phosphate nucleotidyltransferase [Saccharopolyspora sp. ID03-671]|uniref:sugar phosphate nucleotidyltransferase n=1 Tax=Saccharopolyspora sp. ID03-671 TaxID=3073066 RepID=UPI003243EE8A
MPTVGFPAVVTAAGAATRFRPFSDIVPKEMLPLGRTPAVEHVVIECLEAGATEVIVVTRPGDRIVSGHMHALRAEGLPVSTVEEDLSHGYGNATPLLTLRERLTKTTMFAVAFGDDILLAEPRPGYNLATMHRMCADTEAVVAAAHVDPSETRSFGIIDIDSDERLLRIRQRPAPAAVTEPLAVVSRLLLRPSILDRLRPSDLAGGEVDLGIATSQLATEEHVGVHRIAGHWVTVGDPHRYHHTLTTYWNLNPNELPATGAQQP